MSLVRSIYCANGCGCGTGACCINGVCQQTTQSECFAQGGTFRGVDVPCDPDPCGPSGACCFAGGGCLDTTAEECTAAEGSFNLNIPCSSGVCSPSGVCCGLGWRCNYPCPGFNITAPQQPTIYRFTTFVEATHYRGSSISDPQRCDGSPITTTWTFFNDRTVQCTQNPLPHIVCVGPELTRSVSLRPDVPNSFNFASLNFSVSRTSSTSSAGDTICITGLPIPANQQCSVSGCNQGEHVVNIPELNFNATCGYHLIRNITIRFRFEPFILNTGLATACSGPQFFRPDGSPIFRRSNRILSPGIDFNAGAGVEEAIRSSGCSTCGPAATGLEIQK